MTPISCPAVLLAVLCCVYLVIGLGLQLAANRLAVRGSPPDLFPGAEPNYWGKANLDKAVREYMLRGRHARWSQAAFNASAAVLFGAAITGLLVSFPGLAAIGYIVSAATGAFVAYAICIAWRNAQESKAQEKRLIEYDRYAPRPIDQE